MKKNIPIIIGSDHGGYKLKEFLKTELKDSHPVSDMGAYSDCKKVDYPDYAKKVALELKKKKGARGILICSTGIGISMAANKLPGIRAALVHDVSSARMSRAHNDANVLVLKGKVFNRILVKRILKAWLNTPFEGGRHIRRLRKLSALERPDSP